MTLVRRVPVMDSTCPRRELHDAVLGRVLATVRGTLGTAVIAGRHGLIVCTCSLADAAATPTGAVWAYERVVRLAPRWTGSLPVLELTIDGRSDPLPLIVMDLPGMASALVAIRRVQHLIDADRAARHLAVNDAAPVPEPPTLDQPRLILVAGLRT
jgi:hypothetical protein